MAIKIKKNKRPSLSQDDREALNRLSNSGYLTDMSTFQQMGTIETPTEQYELPNAYSNYEYQQKTNKNGLADGDWTSSWHGMHNRRLDTDLQSQKQELGTLNLQKEDLIRAQKYILEYQELKDVEKQLKGNISEQDRHALEQKKAELQYNVTEAEQFFKNNRKGSDVLRNIFYDTRRGFGDDLSLLKRVALENSIEDPSANNKYNSYRKTVSDAIDGDGGLWDKAKKIALGEFGMLEATVENMATSAFNALRAGAGLIDYATAPKYNRFIDKSIANSRPDDNSFDRFFRNAEEITSTEKSLTEFNDYIKSNLSDINQDIADKKIEISEIENNLKNGIKIAGDWYLYDPKKIDKDFKKSLDNYDFSFWERLFHPSYTFVELGSTLSDLEHFAELTAIDAASGALFSEKSIGALAKYLATKSVGGPYAKIAQALVSNTKEISTLAQMAALGTGVYLTTQQRKHETRSEVFDAYTNRAINAMIEQGVDLRKVCDYVDKFVEDNKQHGIDVGIISQESDFEKVKTALALNLKTDDPKYNSILEECRKGLNKVWNENQSLAAKDYLEQIMLMDWSGRIIKDAVKGLSSAKKGVIGSLEDQTYKYMQNQKPGMYANAIVDKTLGRIIKSPMARIMSTRPSKYFASKAKSLMEIAPLEAVEEGQQHLLQTRYEAGLYDDYYSPKNTFDIHSMFEDADLATQAVASYLGINYGDPTNGQKEIRKAMDIGFFTSLWFMPPHAITNAFGAREDNIRGLVSQLRADNKIRGMMADFMNDAQGEDHVEKYYNAFQKAGVNIDTVMNTLNEMKRFKGDLVKDQYIDDDILLANDVYNAYKSDMTKEYLKLNNIPKNSPVALDLVKEMVKVSSDFRNAHGKYFKERDNSDKELDILNELNRQAYDKYVEEGEDGKKTVSERAGIHKKFLQYILDGYAKDRDKLKNLRDNYKKNKSFLNEIKQLLIKTGMSEEEAEAQKEEQARKYLFDDYTDEERKSGILKYSGLDHGEQDISVYDYMSSKIEELLRYKELKDIKTSIDELQNRQSRFKLIRDEMAVDIDVDGLGSIIDYMKERYDYLKAYSDYNLDKSGNAQLKILNNIKKAVKKIAKTKKNNQNLKQEDLLTVDDLLDQAGYFGNVDNYIKSMISMNINGSVMRSLSPVYNAMWKRSADPIDALKAVTYIKWNQLDEDQRNEYRDKKRQEAINNGKQQPSEKSIISSYYYEQNDKIHKFRKLVADYEKMKNESDHDRPLDDIDEAALMKEAADLLVQFKINQRIKDKNREKLFRREEAQEEVEDQEEESRGNFIATENPQPGDNGYGIIQDIQANENGNQDGDFQGAASTMPMSEELASILGISPDGVGEEASQAEKNLAKTLGLDVKPAAPDKQEEGEKGEGVIPTPKPDESPDVKEKNVDIEQINATLNSILLDFWQWGRDAIKNLHKSNVVNDQNEKVVKDYLAILFNQFFKELDEIKNKTSDPNQALQMAKDLIDKFKFNFDKFINEQIIENRPGQDPVKEEKPADDGGFVAENHPEDQQAPEGDPNDITGDDQPETNMQTNDSSSIDTDFQANDVSYIDTTLQANDASYIDTNLQVNGPESSNNEDDSSAGNMLKREHVDAVNVEDKDQAEREYLGYSFFYQPKATDKINLSINDAQTEANINTTYELGTGSELAQKLLDKEWINRCECYYVCHGNIKEKGLNNADAISVALFIDDHEGKKTYVCSMKTPGKYSYKTKDGYTGHHDGLTEIFNTLKSIGISEDNKVKSGRKLIIDHSKYIKEYNDYFINKYKYEAGISPKSDVSEEDARRWYDQLDEESQKRVINECDYKARKSLSDEPYKVLTTDQIWQQIQTLRDKRNRIIERYCTINEDGTITLPYPIRKDVTPQKIVVSNGKFNNDLGSRRSLFECKAFGISDNTNDISNQIQSGQVQIGFGRGFRANNPYQISPITNPDVYYDRIGPSAGKDRMSGRSGSIYVMVDHFGQTIPVMVSARKLNYQEGIGMVHQDSLQLCIDPNTGIINNTKNGVKPSIGEIVMFMMFDKLNKSNYPLKQSSLSKTILDILVNHGSHTLDGASDSKFLQNKQLSIVVGNDGIQKIYVPGVDEFYSVNQLFPVKSKEISQSEFEKIQQEAANNRKTVAAAISENINWNTPTTTANNSSDVLMGQQMPQNLVKALKTYFEESGAEEFKFCGLDQISFKKSDFFDEGMNQKNCILAAWMIANGHLQTDMNDQLFSEPFVFAGGISDVKSVSDDTMEKAKIPGGARVENVIKESEKKSESKKSKSKSESIIRAKNIQSLKNAKDEDLQTLTGNSRKKVLESYQSGNVLDAIILSVSKKEAVSNKSKYGGQALKAYKEILNQRIGEYVQFAKEQGIIPEGSEISINIPENIAEELLNEDNKVPMLYVQDKGDNKISVSFMLEPYASVFENRGYTGVFSKIKEGLPITVEQARQYMKDKLGLEKEDVICLDKLFDALTNEEVFGVIEMCSDVLLGERPIISLSGSNKFGSTYHEAFHYVNLLFHDKQQRDSIYREYVEKRRKDLRTATRKEIEENLANDFNKYAGKQEDMSISGKIKRAFSRFLDFINIFKQKDAVEELFESIQNGNYKSSRINEESLAEFKKAYGGIVHNKRTSIPGANQKYVDKLEYINNSKRFFEVCDVLAHAYLDSLGINNVFDISKINGNYTKFLNNEISKAEVHNQIAKARILKEVLNNKQLFLRYVLRFMDQFGIRGKAGKIKEDDTKLDNGNKSKISDNAQTREEVGNTYDIESSEISRKDNVAGRAKFFLGKIPKLRFSEDIEGNSILVPVTDPLLGMKRYWSFDEAWDKILETLWNVETFDRRDDKTVDDKTDNYHTSSLMYQVKFRSFSDPFYAALYQKLQECYYYDEESLSDEKIPDIQLQNQILATIKSSKPVTSYAKVAPVKTTAKYQYTEGSEGYSPVKQQKSNQVKDLDFTIFKDSAYRAKSMLPRQWSKNAVVRGIGKYKGDGANLKLVANGEYINNLMKMFIPVRDALFDVTIAKKKQESYTAKNIKPEDAMDVYNDVMPQIIDVMNRMGIPADRTVLDYMVLEDILHNSVGSQNLDRSKINDDYNLKVKALQRMFTKSTGSIPYFIYEVLGKYKERAVKANKGNSRRVKDVSMDELYYGYKEDSFITKYAVAFSSIHPTPSDFSTTAPDGKQIYPISENNYISDRTREIVLNIDNFIDKMRKCPYQQRSQLLNGIISYAGDLSGVKENQLQLVLFSGIRDEESKDGKDYFGMTKLEDFVCKMVAMCGDIVDVLDGNGSVIDKKMKNRMMILPTMADKKTYYALAHKIFEELFVDDVVTLNIQDEIGSMNAKRFRDETLRKFHGYFMDELDTIIQFYNKDNIKNLIENPNLLDENYRGKITEINGEKRLDISGNGGFFRYCYDYIIDPTTGLNLNQMIEAIWQSQKKLEQPTFVGKDAFRERDSSDTSDGFELVRNYLNELKQKYGNFAESEEIQEGINASLIRRAEADMERAANDPDNNIIQKNQEGFYIPKKIPRHILGYHMFKINKSLGVNVDVQPYSNPNGQIEINAAYSVMANHTVNTMMSLMEYEKVYGGDQAQFKWNYFKEKQKVTITVKDQLGKQHKSTVEIKILKDKNTDRVKRLGSGISPGQNVRTQYSQEILERYPELAVDQFTNGYISDYKVISDFLNESSGRFKNHGIVEYLKYKNTDLFNDILFDYNIDEKEFNKRFYVDRNQDFVSEIEKRIPKNDFEEILKNAAMQAGPYGGSKKINVSDAQVLIRPSAYRKIRIGLGEWSDRPDETGYCDEAAYQLLENGIWKGEKVKPGEWMYNEEMFRFVERLELYPLKMTYFDNVPTFESVKQNDDGSTTQFNLVKSIYNKQCIFPAFKFMFTSQQGRDLYERMNRENNELDMLTFESAVKVGLNQVKPSPVSKSGAIDGSLMSNSDQYIDSKNVVQKNQSGEGGLFHVTVQKYSKLLMQLNTESHDAEQRNIGSQMFKLAFSDLVDDWMYGSRSGREIKTDIMSCINALSRIGDEEVSEKYVGDQKSKNLLLEVIRNNDLGENAEDIIRDGYPIDALSSSMLFEQSVQKKVNSNVVEIKTNGGSAIQQSAFGFYNFNGEKQIYDDRYIAYNDGKKLKWITENNSMEVLLSINFFKHVVPKKYQTSYISMRRWLIDHDFINGLKSEEYWKHASEEELHKHSLLQNKVVEMNFSVATLKILEDNGIVTLKDLIDGKPKLDHDRRVGKKIMSELDDFLESLNLGWDTDTNIKVEKVYSNPKPFGIGYRIPTQGMSSMFAFVVADVIPSQCADLIVVPEEFTAQTGSDFDVDKLFLATFSYDGDGIKYDSDIFDKSINKQMFDRTEKYCNIDSENKQKAIQNRLLSNYIDLITDPQNFANARASIDTYTDIIMDKVVNRLRKTEQKYLDCASELISTYQSDKKQEFSTGKSGIGAFALNVTNHALTQFTGLCMYFGVENPYELGKLNSITDQEGMHILGWLSAMVNAHVDVAKDPYIFVMNINSATYNMTNFLIRAGKGKSTFSFIAQPILKEYANSVNSMGGYFGVEETVEDKGKSITIKKAMLVNRLLKKNYQMMVNQYKKQKDSLSEEEKKIWESRISNIQVKDGKDGFSMTVKSNRFDKGIFDFEDMMQAAEDYREDGSGTFQSYYYQVMSMRGFKRMEKYADEMSQLVLNSRIDTKKFGNNIASQLHFLNKYMQFKYNTQKDKVYWYIDNNFRPKDSNGNEAKRDQDGNYYFKVKIEREDPSNKGKQFEKIYLTPQEVSEYRKKWLKNIQDTDDRSAVSKYFENTFLNDKLIRATSLPRRILKGKSFTATDTFRDIFLATMAALYGSAEINDGKSTGGIRAYEGTYVSEKTVQSVAKAIRSIFKALAVRNYTGKINDSKKYIGSVNFLPGLDDTNIKNRELTNTLHLIKQYIDGVDNGTEHVRPLFERLANLITYLQSEPNPETASQEEIDLYNSISDGLAVNGNIENDFLNFVRPIPKTKKYPMGTILLNGSSFDTSASQENILNSSFNELFTHPNQKIREIAHKLAIYSFYTSYGNNERDSFFKYIPKKYKIQFLEALRQAMRSNEKQLRKKLGIHKVNDSYDYSEIVTTIARNYWYDPKIIPSKNNFTITKLAQKMSGKYHNNGKLYDISGFQTIGAAYFGRIPGIIITDNASGLFFTTGEDQNINLYRKVGTLLKTVTKSSGEQLTTGTSRYGVYFITPKLGRHMQGSHRYELINSNEEPSIYPENDLDNQQDDRMLWSVLSNLLDDADHFAEDKQQFIERNPKLDLSKMGGALANFEDVSMGFQKEGVLSVAGNYKQTVNGGWMTWTEDNSIHFVTTKTPLKNLIKESDIVLNFGLSIPDSESSGKVVNMGRKFDVETIYKSLIENIDKLPEGVSPKIGLVGSSVDITVTEDHFKKFVDFQVQEYYRRHSQDEVEDGEIDYLSDENVSRFRKYAEQESRNQVGRHQIAVSIFRQVISKLYDYLQEKNQATGNNIGISEFNTICTSEDQLGFQKAFMDAAILDRDLFGSSGSQQLSVGRVFVNKVSEKNLSTSMAIAIAYNNGADNITVLSDLEEDQMYSIVKSQEIIENEMGQIVKEENHSEKVVEKAKIENIEAKPERNFAEGQNEDLADESAFFEQLGMDAPKGEIQMVKEVKKGDKNNVNQSCSETK